MKTNEDAQGLRGHLPLAPKREDHFRWRGQEVTRIEGLTDAVFGFAVTLLAMALEVPKTFEGLLDVLRGMPAFVISFVLLMTFWNAHYRFHRRYGLEDAFSRVLTMAIIVLVLFLVYPLKFLFSMVTENMFGLGMSDAPRLDSREQVDQLYLIYGIALASVWGLYAILYQYALRKRAPLGLDAMEVLYTKNTVISQLIYVFVCGVSIVLALTTRSDSLPGFIYFLLGPLHAINGWWFGRKAARLAAVPG